MRDARLVCVYRHAVMAEYMSGLLAPLVARDLAEEQKKDQAKRSQKGEGDMSTITKRPRLRWTCTSGWSSTESCPRRTASS